MHMEEKEAFKAAIGERVRKIRKDKAISLSELGLLGSFDKQALSKIENGKKEITVFSLKKVCQSLGVSLKEFFSEGFD